MDDVSKTTGRLIGIAVGIASVICVFFGAYFLLGAM